jgi:hypothetical protein
VSFVVVDVPQRSTEWHQARLGRLCGSYAADMTATIKSGEAAARRDLRLRLVCERLTGRPQDDGWMNDAMRRGIELEPAAFAAYEALTGNVAERVGFLSHAEHMAGCSPDGYVGKFEGLVSLKCPKSATHLRYLRGGIMPQEYVPQMHHELWISGAKFYDFLSFDDRFPVELQVFYVRVPRNDANIAAYKRMALAFLNEVETEVQAVQTMANLPAQLQKSVEARA